MPRLHLGLTVRASCLVAAGLTALVCGLLLGVLDLIRAGLLAVALPLAAALVVYRSRMRLTNRRAVRPPRVVCGEPVTIQLSLANRSPLPTGALMLEDQLPWAVAGDARFVLDGLAGRETREVAYRIPGLGRGRYHTGPLRIRITDPFQLIDISRSFTATSDFLVTPIVDPLPLLAAPRSWDVGENAGSHSVGSHGADDASTRDYRTGDDLRKIHWRSSARRGALMVRQEERPWQGHTTLLLDTRRAAHHVAVGEPDSHDDRDRNSLEWLISAAASIGTRLLLDGRRLDVLDGRRLDVLDGRRLDPADRAEAGTIAEPARLIEELTVLQPSAAAELTRMAGPLRRAARETVLIALLGSLDPSSARTLAECHPRGAAFPAMALLLDTLSWALPEPAASDPALPGPTDPAQRAAAGLLRAAGWRIVTVRRGMSTASAWRSLLHAASAGRSLAQVRG